MGLISGNKILHVGVQRFDEEHGELVAITNRLHDAIKAGTGPQAVQETLQHLSVFAGRHFCVEEELLEQHGFAGLAEHRQAHQAILSRLAEIQAEFEGGDLSLHHNVMQFLLEWLSSHTKNLDKQYGPFLNSKGIY